MADDRVKRTSAAGAPADGPAPGPAEALPGDALVLRAAEDSLAGRRRGLRRFTPFLGPAFIAAVSYIDPGNFATNMAAGARYGFLLTWVVVVAILSDLPNDLWQMFAGSPLYANPAWLPIIEFPWRILAGTLVTVAVALCFKTPDTMRQPAHERSTTTDA